MNRREKLSGFCAGCGALWPHGRQYSDYYSASWALDRLLETWEVDGMIYAVAVACETTREEAVQMIGQAANREGKTFEESLVAYFHLYAGGQIPRVEGYRGRVASRGLNQPRPTPVQPEPAAPVETLYQVIETTPTSGRICSRGVRQ